MQDVIEREFSAYKEVIQKIDGLKIDIERAASLIIDALKHGNKILIFGNGGSAADAQHFAAELSGRYKIERAGLAGMALNVDTSALTAIGNDYGFDCVFSRQLEALGRDGDVAFGISTSGNSLNVLKALELARAKNMRTIGLCGRDGGKQKEFCEVNLIMPSTDTPRIQELHILVIHTICQLIDEEFKK